MRVLGIGLQLCFVLETPNLTAPPREEDDFRSSATALGSERVSYADERREMRVRLLAGPRGFEPRTSALR